MPKTSEQLAIRALSILGKVQAGQTPATEDVAAVVDVIEPLVAQIGIGSVVYVGDLDSIDDAIFLPLARRLALEVAPDFGLPAVDKDTIDQQNAVLRALAANAASGFPVRVTYY